MEERKNFIDDNYKTVEKNDERIKKLNQKKEEILMIKLKEEILY